MSFNQPPPPPPPPGYAPPPPPPSYYGPPMQMGAPSPQPARRGGTAIIGLFVGVLVGVAVLVGIIVLANQPPPPTACGSDVVCPPEVPPTLAPSPSGPTAPPGTLSPIRTPTPAATPAPTEPGQTPQPTDPGQTPQPTDPGQTIAPSTPVPTAQSGAPPFVGGTVWRSSSLGYSFEYDEGLWEVVTDKPAYAQLFIRSNRFSIELNVLGFPGEVSVDEALQNIYTQTDSFVIGRAVNTRPYDALMGPGIGYVRGDGGVFTGTFKKADGTPGDPVGISVMAATNGRVTIAVILLVTDPDTAFGGGTLWKAAGDTADSIVKTVLWEAGQ